MKIKLLALFLALSMALCACSASANGGSASGADGEAAQSARSDESARPDASGAAAEAQSIPAQYPNPPADWEERLRLLEENPVEDSFLSAVNRFAMKSAAQLLREQGGCYAPLSLYYALALTAQGANGQTQAELCELLGAERSELAEQCGSLFRRLYCDDEEGTLLLANSVWMDREVQGEPVQFREAFLKAAAEQFYASVFTVDFSDPATGPKIGDWIAENTGNLLRFEPEVNEDQLLTLINTIYYKSPWLDPFEESATAEAVFTAGDGQEQTVPFLHRSGEGAYYKGEGYAHAALNLGRGRMHFYLPDEGVDVHSLLERENLLEEPQTAPESGKTWLIDWSVPKFTAENTWDLVSTLEALGVRSAFSDAADFSDLTEVPARLSSVQQGTHLGLDENGVEAAAYTMMALDTASLEPEEPERVEMKLDRPFLYTLTSSEGAVLFLGICDTVE